MPDQTTEAAPQPVVAPVATQSSGEKNTGSGNQTVQQYARRLFSEAPAAPAEPVAAPAAETATETAPAPSAETQPEAPAQAETPEADPKEKADDALSKSTSQIEFTPEQQAIFDKRLGKEIAKRKELERQLEEAKATKPVETPVEPPQQQPTIVPLPSGVAPLANIHDVKGLSELQQQAKEAIRFAEDALANEAEGEPLPEGYTRKTLRDVIRNAKLTVEDHIPARVQFLQQRNQFQQTAYELLPWLKDKNDPNYVTAESFRRNNPWLHNLPAGDLIVGMYIKGVEAVKAEREAAEKAKAKPAAAKTTPKPSGAQAEVSADALPTRATPGTQQRQAMQLASEKLKAKGAVSAKDYASHLAQKELLKTR